MDSMGDGRYQASRIGRTHSGVDIEKAAGSPVVVPITGVYTRMAYPYTGNTSLTGVVIAGTGIYQGWELKMFYVFPSALINSHLENGALVGFAQNLHTQYPTTMKNHIHVEIRINGRLIDPTDFITKVGI
jgi:murein DD-endopeptidase MepM/ murein hydrolase activator NlpD